MTAEQLVTAGTTTPRCLRELGRWAAKRGLSAKLHIRYFDAPGGPGGENERRCPEAGKPPKKRKKVNDRRGLERRRRDDGEGGDDDDDDEQTELRPVKLHAKVTIVDGERMLLGSGNMDAASWGTSQELGVLVEGREVVGEWIKLWGNGGLGELGRAET